MKTLVIKGNLEDFNTGDSRKVPLEVILQNGTLLIRFQGKNQADDEWPIMLDLFEKSVSLTIWSDVNNPEPTHVISLDSHFKTSKTVKKSKNG